MSDPNGTSSENPTSKDLEALGKKVQAAQKAREPEVVERPDTSLIGMAWRISTELVVAVIVGTAMGYGVGVLIGSKTVPMIIGLVIGIIAGMRNTFRLIMAMDKASKEE